MKALASLTNIVIVVMVLVTNITSCATNLPVKYLCERGTELNAKFNNDGSAVDITIKDGLQMTLPVIPSGSGFIYGNGRYELRGKGKDATWTVGRMTTEHCKAHP